MMDMNQMMGGGRPISRPNPNQIMQKYGMMQMNSNVPNVSGALDPRDPRIGHPEIAGQIMPQLSQNARQGLVGPQMLKQAMAGRPMGVATGMGMTPPSKGVFNPELSMATRGDSLPFARQKADGIMKKYGMGGVL